VGHIDVETRHGFYPIEYACITAFNSEVLSIRLSNDTVLRCSPEHLWFTTDWTKACDLKCGDKLLTKEGYVNITSIEEDGFENLFDLQVGTVKEFYANDVVSHNSSMISDPISFVLFGRAFRNINKPALINSINQKDMVVEVFFSSGGFEYKVVRGLKPNIFEIYKNNVLIPQPGNIKDYQKILEESILKFNFKSFTQIVILGNASYTPFMNLPAKDRRDVIEDLLDIQIFSSMSVLLKDRLSNNKNELTSIRNEKSLLEERINVQKKYLSKIKMGIEKQIEDIKTEINRNKQCCIDIVAQIKEKQSTIDGFLKRSENIGTIKAKASKIYDVLTKIKDKKIKEEKNILFYQENDHCPTCEQSLLEHIKGEKIGKAKELIDQYSGAIEKLDTDYNNIIQEFSVIEECQKSIRREQVSIKELQSKVVVYESTIENYLEKMNQLKEPNQDQQETTIEEMNEVLTALNKRLESLLEEKELLLIGYGLLKDGGIKTRIVRQYIPIINKFVNKYLASLDFFVNFELDEEFNEKIKSRYRDEFSYSSFSEGEKTRINLALLLAWRAVSKLKNSTNTNLLILDEVFDGSMDNLGIDVMMGLLNELEGTNVFVISHRGDGIVDRFQNAIRVEKYKNFSIIV